MTLKDGDELNVYQRGKHNDALNAEPDLDQLTSNFITPTTKLFHRNHDEIVYQPKVEEVNSDWKLTLRVDREVAEEQRWSKWEEQDAKIISLDDLIHSKGTCQGLQHIDTTATIECAGNRREELGETGKAEGIQWGPGVIANVYWSGSSIRSLLLLQGVADPYSHHSDLSNLTPSDDFIAKDCAPWAQALHLHLLSVQPTSESEKAGGEFFGASIPLSTALHPNQNCILAHQHNGKILTQAHGYPIRAVIPGHAGARWVKWMSGLRISKFENDSPGMQLDYKILSPRKTANEEEVKEWKGKMMGEDKDVDFRKEQLDQQRPMQRLGMGSAIETPQNNETIQGNAIEVKGYAVGQDGSPVSLIECIILVEQGPSEEGSSSLRDRAERCPSTEWTRAEVQSSPGATEDDLSKEAFSWAWSLWEAKVPLPASNDNSKVTYGLVARATTASGIQQEKESPWNVRGFQTRSWPVIRGLKIAPK